MKKSLFIFLIALIYIPIYGQDVQLNSSPAADSILGTWQTADQKAQITITRKDSLYYGKLSNATLSIDKKINLHLPTSLLGIYILQGFKYSGDNRWDGIILIQKVKKLINATLNSRIMVL